MQENGNEMQVNAHKCRKMQGKYMVGNGAKFHHDGSRREMEVNGTEMGGKRTEMQGK